MQYWYGVIATVSFIGGINNMHAQSMLRGEECPEIYIFVLFSLYAFCTTPRVYTRVKPPNHVANIKAE